MDFSTIYRTYLLVYGKDYSNPATAAADGFPDVPTAMRTAAETFSIMGQLGNQGIVTLVTDTAHPLGYWVPVGSPGTVSIAVPDSPYQPGTITTLPLPPMPVTNPTVPPGSTTLNPPTPVPGPGTPTVYPTAPATDWTTYALIAAGIYLFWKMR